MEVEQQQESPLRDYQREYHKEYYKRNIDKCRKIANDCYHRKSPERKKEINNKSLERKENKKVYCNFCKRDYLNFRIHKNSKKHILAESHMNNSKGV